MQQFLIANILSPSLCECSLYTAHLGKCNSKFSKFTFLVLYLTLFSIFSSPPYTYIKLQYFNLGKGAFYVK